MKGAGLMRREDMGSVKVIAILLCTVDVVYSLALSRERFASMWRAGDHLM